MVDNTAEKIIETMRRAYGPRFVAARQEAEEEARRFINTRLGFMNTEDVLSVGQLFNRHEKAGQRFSTVRSADRILVVDGGVVTASGTHDELLRRDPYYQRLATTGAAVAAAGNRSG